MVKNYTPPYLILLFLVSIINIIFTTYFVTFLLAGVAFKIFALSIKKEYNYMLLVSIFVFLVIENAQGFFPFSLTLISVIVYYFIMPKIKHIFSSKFMYDVLFVFCFYLLMYINAQVYSSFDLQMVFKMFMNFIIDIIIIGLIL